MLWGTISKWNSHQLLLETLPGKEGDLHLVESLDEDGMTPLHHAAAAGSEQCCELLLGPNWRLPVDSRDLWVSRGKVVVVTHW